MNMPFMRKFTFVFLLGALLFSAGGCHRKAKAPEARIHEVYGTVESIDQKALVIRSKGSDKKEFAMVESSIKGGDFGPGALVHVYYRVKDQRNEVTMVVEKID